MADKTEPSDPAQFVAEGKGKGKAVHTAPHDVSMGEEESSSDEETGAEEDEAPELPEEDEEDEEDNMEEIDTDNIISGGRRTRGKFIDFAKAAENELDDDDDEEDDDFEVKEDDEAAMKD